MFQIEVLTGRRIKYPDKMVKLFFDIDLPIIMKRRKERVFSRKTVRSKKGKKEDSKFAELHEEVAKS